MIYSDQDPGQLSWSIRIIMALPLLHIQNCEALPSPRQRPSTRPVAWLINLYDYSDWPQHGTKLHSKHFIQRHCDLLLLQHTIQNGAINSAGLMKITVELLQSHLHLPETYPACQDARKGARKGPQKRLYRWTSIITADESNPLLDAVLIH
jgi:hypothetical protein